MVVAFIILYTLIGTFLFNWANSTRDLEYPKLCFIIFVLIWPIQLLAAFVMVLYGRSK